MCDCLGKMDAEAKKLFGLSAQIDWAMTFDIGINTMTTYPRLRILYKKREGQKKDNESTLIPSYCPFCGEAYNVPVKEEPK